MRVQVRLEKICVLLTGGLAVSSIMDEAEASAWSHEQGGGFQSISGSFERGDFGRNWRQDSYLEYGLAKHWNVSGKLETVWREGLVYEPQSGGELSVHRHLFSRGNWVMSAHSGLLMGEKLDDESCDGTGAEIGIELGYSSILADMPFFASADLSRGSRKGCEQATVDVVLGVNVTDKWRTDLKFFSEQYPRREFVKTEVTLNREFGAGRLGVAAGMRTEVSGAFEEDSVFLSIWRKF